MSEDMYDERFAEFVAKTIRGPRFGAFEQLVAQHLVAAVASDPLRKIRLVCEAAYMCNPEKLNIDLDRLEVTYKVATSLMNAVAHPDFPVPVYTIPWAFEPTAENFKRYIEPWLTGRFSYSYQGPEDERRKIVKAIQEMEKHEAFFTITMGRRYTKLPPDSYWLLVNQFIGWAIPFVQQVFEKVSRTVSPTVYNEVLRVMARTGEAFPRERGRRETSMGERG